jgi:phosphoglycolate phosphatase-like HAD superfamily hydrolase
VTEMVCGNDPIPGKPMGDGIVELARRFGVPTERVAMVGDSVTDMRAAQAARAGFRIAVRSGTGDHVALAAASDVLIDNINAIRPL